VTYEQQLRDALKNRAAELDERRPASDELRHDNANIDGIASESGIRRWQFGAVLAVAAAGALIFGVTVVGNRAVDRVETGPPVATQPTERVPAPSAAAQLIEDTAAQVAVATARGLGPTTVVDVHGVALFKLGTVVPQDALPVGVGPEVVVRIEAELLALPVLGEHVSERRQALADAGLVVQVALDLDAQRRALTAIEMVPDELDAVAVSVDHRTGGIVSAVSRSGRSLEVAQPAGSARIVTYAAAFELGFTPQSMIDGAGPCEIQTDDGSVMIDNFGESSGGVSLVSQQALRASRCAEARLETLAGSGAISELMQSMMGADLDGMIVHAPPVTAIEHVAAIAAVSNGGERPAIGFVSQVKSADGVVVFERPGPTRVVSVETAEAVVGLLQSNVERGTGTRAELENAVAGGFSGTDINFLAAWFVGSASGRSTVVWLARSDGASMLDVDGRNVTGGSYPADLWARIHEGFAAVQELDAGLDNDPPPEAPRPSFDLCPRGFPVGADSDDDGEIDTCYRDPANPAFIRPTPPTPVDEESCPSSHPVPADVNGDGTNETCVTAGFTFGAPAADYATSIEVKMQAGQVAAGRYATLRGRERYLPGSLIYVGSALSGTDPVDLFRYRAIGEGPVNFGSCLGTASLTQQSLHGICQQVENPGIGPNTGGRGPVSDGGVEIDPTHSYLLDNAPLGAHWFVIDTKLGARVIANVVGQFSMASWPSEAGGPARFSVLDADHVELWSSIQD